VTAPDTAESRRHKSWPSRPSPRGLSPRRRIIKEFGTNGGGFMNANSAHPFENPTPLSNFFEMVCIFAISAGLTYTLGQMTGSPKHGWAVWGGNGLSVSRRRHRGLLGRSSGEPVAGRGGCRSDGKRPRARRQHGGEGVPVRHRQLSAVRDGHDRCELRRDQRLARLVHSTRRPCRAA
jgi:hypothetical protein